MLYSEDDAVGRPSERLFDIAIGAIAQARKTKLDFVCHRLQGRFNFADNILNVWPGEHYRLLAGLIQTLQPKLVIEIGTAEGMSALTILEHLPVFGRIVTFDLISWPDYPRPCLQQTDFADGRLQQIVGNLGDTEYFATHKRLLCQADFIFIDAAKDGVLEKRLIANFSQVQFQTRPIFMFDDIRIWNMLDIWRDLHWPKLDLTSFGHWAGTGLCELPA